MFFTSKSRKPTCFFALFILLLILPAASQAATFRSGKSTTIKQGKIVNDDLYIAGNNVRVEGTINGDLVAAGGTVTITGQVNGDLIAAGGQILLKGDVEETARLIGGNIMVNGNISKDLVIAGRDLDLSKESRVGRDLIAGAGALDFAGLVGRRFYGGIDHLKLNGQVGRTARLKVDQLKLGSRAQIGGDLKYKAPRKAQISPNAEIRGEETFTKAERKKPQRQAAAIAGKLLIGLVWLLILGAVLFLLFPGFGFRTTAVMDNEPWKSVGWGFLLLIVTPFAVLILLITVISIPVALIMLLLYLLAIYLSKIYVGHYLGTKILTAFLKHPPHWFWSLLTGLVIIMMLALIPFIGFMVRFAIVLWGLGALALVTSRYIGSNRATTT